MTAIFVGTSIAYALLCIVPAAMKLGGTAKMRTAAEHFGVSWSRYRAIGFLEVAAAAGVLAGTVWRPIGLAAAVGMIALLIGALMFHCRARDEFGEFISALVFLVASVGYVAVWVTS